MESQTDQAGETRQELQFPHPFMQDHPQLQHFMMIGLLTGIIAFVILYGRSGK